MTSANWMYRLLGLLLFAAYLLQHFLDVQWPALAQLQAQENFKILSGSILLILILFQWYLSRVKANPFLPAEKVIRQHNLHIWLGVCSPILYYLHSASPGYALLLVLSVLFFGNLILGMVNPDSVPLKQAWYAKAWMILHVSISCLITTLIVVHVFQVAYYE